MEGMIIIGAAVIVLFLIALFVISGKKKKPTEETKPLIHPISNDYEPTSSPAQGYIPGTSELSHKSDGMGIGDVALAAAIVAGMSGGSDEESSVEIPSASEVPESQDEVGVNSANNLTEVISNDYAEDPAVKDDKSETFGGEWESPAEETYESHDDYYDDSSSDY